MTFLVFVGFMGFIRFYGVYRVCRVYRVYRVEGCFLDLLALRGKEGPGSPNPKRTTLNPKP